MLEQETDKDIASAPAAEADGDPYDAPKIAAAPTSSVFGDRLRCLMDSQSVGISDLAKISGISISTLSRHLRHPGGHNPSFRTVERIAAALKVPLSSLSPDGGGLDAETLEASVSHIVINISQLSPRQFERLMYALAQRGKIPDGH